MRHRHSGPKVQYRTRRNRIRYRERPMHSQMDNHKNMNYRQLRRRESIGDEEDLERIDNDIGTLEEQMDGIKDRMRVLNRGMNTLTEIKDKYGGNPPEDVKREIYIRADSYADEMDELERNLDLKSNERNRMEAERHSLGKPRWFKDIYGEEFESGDED